MKKLPFLRMGTLVHPTFRRTYITPRTFISSNYSVLSIWFQFSSEYQTSVIVRILNNGLTPVRDFLSRWWKIDTQPHFFPTLQKSDPYWQWFENLQVNPFSCELQGFLHLWIWSNRVDDKKYQLLVMHSHSYLPRLSSRKTANGIVFSVKNTLKINHKNLWDFTFFFFVE